MLLLLFWVSKKELDNFVNAMLARRISFKVLGNQEVINNRLEPRANVVYVACCQEARNLLRLLAGRPSVYFGK